ncbi:MAG TPA: ferritin family protein [Quisquiliibacterium sp.]|nr:ferritin family protein [Quisquiliibacterium sp.]
MSTDPHHDAGNGASGGAQGGGARVADAHTADARSGDTRSGDAPRMFASMDDMMANAYALEAEAAERYAEFADLMEAHNNREVAELFRKMARIENLHAQQILERMGWSGAAPAPRVPWRWEGMEGPETGDHADLHYLMTPHHALQVARMNEERARRFYAELVRRAPEGALRDAAVEMEEEEAEHVRLIDAWIARTPAPEEGWDVDLDPPNYTD